MAYAVGTRMFNHLRFIEEKDMENRKTLDDAISSIEAVMVEPTKRQEAARAALDSGSEEAKVRELVGEVLWRLGIDISNSGDCAEWVVTKTKPAAKEEASMKDSVVYKYDDMERLESALTHHDFGCTVSYHSEETFHIAMGTANMYATKVVLSWDGRIATAKGYIGDVNTFRIHTVCDLPTMGD